MPSVQERVCVHKLLVMFQAAGSDMVVCGRPGSAQGADLGGVGELDDHLAAHDDGSGAIGLGGVGFI